MKYVYEFTNKRKLTKREFIHWFEKKFLYTIRKFSMIKKEDVVSYESKDDFRVVVLEYLLKLYADKSFVRLIKNGKKYTKKAIANTTDTEALKMAEIIIKGKAKQLDELAPVYKKTIKPLFLFLDKEVLLYARLMNLKFKEPKIREDKIANFVNSLEVKHPEIKNSIISSYLEMFS